ncbi:MAG: hypothetical protein V4537_03335 [Pseudomonadota bacterium]
MRHFVHLSSEQRALALESVCDARGAFERNPFSGWGAHPFGFEVSASIGHRKCVERFASLHLHTSGLTLGFWSEKGREVGNVRITDETAGSVNLPRGGLSWILNKLDAWSEALREEADWNERMSVEQARSRTIRIITAAAQRYDPSWMNAYLTRDVAGQRPVLHLQTFSKGMSAAQVFHGGQAREETGGMTPALEHLIATNADPLIHVTVGVGPRNPWVKIGSPPPISFSNPRDPITYLRSFFTITDDAHLLPPGAF